MGKLSKLPRDKQIELIDGAQKRVMGHSAAWIARPEIKAALHRNDAKVKGNDNGQQLRRAAGK